MEPVSTPNPEADRLTRILRIVVGVVIATFVAMAGWYGYAFLISPAAVRHPVSAHYHFRFQLISGGTAVNFADSRYQTEFNKDICTATITKEPFHFHDGLDQFVHVHWDNMTGGLLLKHYGWNFLGGPDGLLGFNFTRAFSPAKVPIHGHALPAPPRDAHYYVYVGNKSGYQEKSWNNFLHQNLRDFFKGAPRQTVLGRLGGLIPTASAHGEEQLTQINDVLGSVVIFAQKAKPTDQQIKDRFNQLVPLPESACGG